MFIGLKLYPQYIPVAVLYVNPHTDFGFKRIFYNPQELTNDEVRFTNEIAKHKPLCFRLLRA